MSWTVEYILNWLWGPRAYNILPWYLHNVNQRRRITQVEYQPMPPVISNETTSSMECITENQTGLEITVRTALKYIPRSAASLWLGSCIVENVELEYLTQPQPQIPPNTPDTHTRKHNATCIQSISS